MNPQLMELLCTVIPLDHSINKQALCSHQTYTYHYPNTRHANFRAP